MAYRDGGVYLGASNKDKENQYDAKEEEEYRQIYLTLINNTESKAKIDMMTRVYEEDKQKYLKEKEREYRMVVRTMYNKLFIEKEKKDREEIEKMKKEAAEYSLSEAQRKEKEAEAKEVERMRKMIGLLTDATVEKSKTDK